MLQGKHILIGISGGIAAYKIPELIRLIRTEGAVVKVTTTKHALEFVTTLTLETLSGNKVYSDVFAAINEHQTEHISLPDWADVMVVAPATANVLGKMSSGIADDALTTTFAAMRKPVVIAPAMNDKMYAQPTTQHALQQLSQREHTLVMDCSSGFLACGTTGKGRMQEPEAIVEAIKTVLTAQDMTGRRVMITAGPTQEAIDPVRYLSNHSSGKMGYALARACRRHGADVVVISGPVSERMPALELWHGSPLRIQPVVSAEQMFAAAQEEFAHCDLAILCAAVADFRPEQYAGQKIKKTPGQETLQLSLRTNSDIAQALGERKQAGQTLVGFALETENEQTNALQKMTKKHLDAIVLNSLREPGAGFGGDTNKVTLYTAQGTKKDIPLMSKEDVAESIIQALLLSQQS